MSSASLKAHAGVCRQILGVQFFDGTTQAAVAEMVCRGGYLVVPAAPALVQIQYDPSYRRALVEADLAIADSGFMVILLRLLRGQKIRRISGLQYLRQLLLLPALREPRAVVWVVPSAAAREKAAIWLQTQNCRVAPEVFYVAPRYGTDVSDPPLIDLLSAQRPSHIVVALGGGTQEKLGAYLRHTLPYRPAIHCIGAALGFLTGDQPGIPDWADRLYLGWLLRLLRHPKLYARRFWAAHELPGLVWKFGRDLPPLRPRHG